MSTKNALHSVKVGDILKKVGTTDTIDIADIKIDESKDIVNIKGEIFLQSISDEDIYMRIDNVSYTSKNICDYCGDSIDQDMKLDKLSYRYMKDIGKSNELNILDKGDDIRPINTNMTIDIITPLSQAIMINSNIQNICNKCKNKKNIGEHKNNQDGDDIGINHPIFIS